MEAKLCDLVQRYIPELKVTSDEDVTSNNKILSAIKATLEPIVNQPDRLDKIFNKWQHQQTGNPIVFEAVLENKTEVVMLLLSYYSKINMNVLDKKSKHSAVLASCMNNNVRLTKTLMDYGCDPNVVVNGKTAIHYCASHNNVKMMDILLDKSNKIPFNWDKLINSTTQYGYTALMRSCQRGCEQMIKYLFSKEKDFKMKINPLLKQANGWNGYDAYSLSFVFSFVFDWHLSTYKC